MIDSALQIKIPEAKETFKVTKQISELETERNRFEDKIEQFQNKIVPPNDEVQVDMFSEINVETESKPISAPRASAMRYEQPLDNFMEPNVPLTSTMVKDKASL